jgi:hypothetical protein
MLTNPLADLRVLQSQDWMVVFILVLMIGIIYSLINYHPIALPVYIVGAHYVL